MGIPGHALLDCLSFRQRPDPAHTARFGSGHPSGERSVSWDSRLWIQPPERFGSRRGGRIGIGRGVDIEIIFRRTGGNTVTRSEIQKLLESLKTPRGGWTRETLASLGVPWPPPRGWRKRLLESGVQPPIPSPPPTNTFELGRLAGQREILREIARGKEPIIGDDVATIRACAFCGGRPYEAIQHDSSCLWTRAQTAAGGPC
jgi:hypothetical protein